jgi:hypothetical protein
MAVSCVLAGEHSAGRGSDNCYSSYAQTNAQQLIDLLTSMDADES